MKSIQTKIILLNLLVIVVVSLAIGGEGIINSRKAIEKDSAEIINLLCSEKAQELNSTLGRIEQSVDIMSEYASAHIRDIDKMVSDDEYRNEYIETVKILGLTAAQETNGAVTYYLRFSPEKFSPTEGFFQVKSDESDDFESHPITDLSKFLPDDIEHVGWYYIPVENGCATWMNPYMNREIDVKMISYVEPVYHDGELVAVVGMDIDFEYISSFIDSITVYESGYAFLTDSDLNIIYHRNGATNSIREFSDELANADDTQIINADKLYDYSWKGENKRVTLRSLSNGMCLAVTAPVSEIDAGLNNLIRQILVLDFFIVVVFIIISSFIARSLARPLKELNKAAKEISCGNLDVKLNVKSKDEIGALAESFRETANQLRHKMNYINNLAYTDSLTGVNNNTAYKRDVLDLCEQPDSTPFSLAIIDINGLKQINDSYGHEYGNILILNTAIAAVNVFGQENVYRIGGDEFAVLLKNTALDECRRLAEKFLEELENNESSVHVVAAIGTAEYTPDDNNYDDVFRRADENMYCIKSEMKKNNKTSYVISGTVS